MTARLYTTLDKVEVGGYQRRFSSYVHGTQRTVDYKGKPCSLTKTWGFQGVVPFVLKEVLEGSRVLYSSSGCEVKTSCG
ncbi:hypothetical protein Taro_002626, partial [Colocasia esculenta]|nr:hypothetical protein [Colocasia esculenta]